MLAELLRGGKSQAEVARQMKRSRSVVNRHALRLAQSEMSKHTFADYLAGRRSTYTQEWHLLQELQRDAAFREANSWEEIERYLDVRRASPSLRSVARSTWMLYQRAKRERRPSERE
jgi:predicted transcriptional regulator